MKLLRSFVRNICNWTMAIGALLFLFAVGYAMLLGRAIVAGLNTLTRRKLEKQQAMIATLFPEAARPAAYANGLVVSLPVAMPSLPAVNVVVVSFPVEKARSRRPIRRTTSAQILPFPFHRVRRM